MRRLQTPDGVEGFRSRKPGRLTQRASVIAGSAPPRGLLAPVPSRSGSQLPMRRPQHHSCRLSNRRSRWTVPDGRRAAGAHANGSVVQGGDKRDTRHPTPDTRHPAPRTRTQVPGATAPPERASSRGEAVGFRDRRGSGGVEAGATAWRVARCSGGRHDATSGFEGKAGAIFRTRTLRTWASAAAWRLAAGAQRGWSAFSGRDLTRRVAMDR